MSTTGSICPKVDDRVEAAGIVARERKIVFALSVAAAIHVFVFSAAFPLFNNADETMHFDLVVKYAQSGIPRALDPISDESLNYIVLFSTAEYFESPTNFPGGKFPPPPWTQPLKNNLQSLLAEKRFGSNQLNYEATEPPLYYKLAAIWWRLGKWCGIHDGLLPFWLRFLNILIVPALVWIAYWTAKFVFPERRFVQLAVPALLAFMPQTAFYSISNDILSSLSFGLAFFCLLHFQRAETPSPRLGVLTGLALAAAFLTKMTNLPLLALSCVVVALKIQQVAKDSKLARSLPSLAALILCAGIPAVIWALWCRSVYGDFTGSAIKAKAFGWTIKPFADWWHHPIFTPRGLWTYLSGEMGTFWQGEFWWHNNPMSLPGTDAVYSLLSLALCGAAMPALFSKFSAAGPSQRSALRWSLACFVVMLAFFALLSVIYDFHDCPNPSREFPYFHAGRMMLGALIPFLLLFARGLDRMLGRIGNTAKFATLASLVTCMLIVEIATDRMVFFNAYNWFHLP